MIALFVSVLLVLLVIGTAIGIALGLTGIFFMILHGMIPLTVISQTVYKNLTSYTFLAIPFFIFVGNLVLHGPILTSIVRFANQLFKNVTGGLAVGVMAISTFFGAISGSSAASAAAIGGATTRALEEQYPKNFVAGLVASGGTIGLMIPPSLAFIVIGGMVGLPVIDLFKAGLGVGLIQGLLLCITVYLICKIRGWGRVQSDLAEKETPREYFFKLGRYFVQSWTIILLPILILGGLFLGLFTPTEISAVSAVYCLIIVMFVYRAITGKQFVSIVQDTLYKSCMIYLIIIGAHLLSYVVTRYGFAQQIIDFLTRIDMSAWQFLLMVNVLLLVLGMFLDGSSMTLLTAPLLFPLATHYGIDPIHFAVIMVANSEIGALTPPVGINLFVMSGVSKISPMQVAKGTLPFYVTMIIFLLIVTYVPQLSLFLL